jgi:hypothetical protein
MSGIYFHPIKRIFLNLSGGTVTGDTVFTQGLSADTFNILSDPLTANTEQSILVRTADGSIRIREASTLIGSGATIQDLQSVMSIGSTSSTASDVVIKSTGGNIISFESDTASLIIGDSLSASSLSMSGDITPDTDNAYDIGTPIRRFRSLNIVDGIAVSFTASTRVKTTQLELGNTTVTENNIILTGNTIDGGDW